MYIINSTSSSSGGGATRAVPHHPDAIFPDDSPQRKRQRQQAELQAAIGVGDEVITSSGVYGFITGLEDDDKFWLEIDDNVQIRIARAAIQGKVGASLSGESVAPKDDKSTDDDDDDAGDGDEPESTK
jgi:preprotein translocase subunit YajC